MKMLDDSMQSKSQLFRSGCVLKKHCQITFLVMEGRYADVCLDLKKRAGCCGDWFTPANCWSVRESHVCAHELHLGSIRTLKSWFLRNFPATTAAWLSTWLLIKTPALVIMVVQ